MAYVTLSIPHAVYKYMKRYPEVCLNRSATLVTRDKHFEFVKAVKNELSLEIVKVAKKSC